MSSRQFMKSSAVKHQMYLNRYSGTIGKQLVGFVNTLRKEIVNHISNLGEAPTLSKKRLTALDKDLNSLTAALTKDMKSKVNKSMYNLAAYEADFTARLLAKATTLGQDVEKAPFESVTPTIQQLKTAAFVDILNKSIPTQGGYDTKGVTIQKFLEDFGINSGAKAATAIRSGYALGKTTPEISKDLISMFSGIGRRQAATVARTVTNHTASQARFATYEENREVIEQYEIVATLDTATTLTCANLDGKRFDADGFTPPPYHPGCRTTYIAVVKEKYNLNLADQGRPTKGVEGEAGDAVNSNTKYETFLKGESKEFRDDFMGVQRSALYDAGMPLGDFVDDKFRPITIEDLKTKDNLHIFEKAGL